MPRAAHRLFLDGVYIDSENESNTRVRWVKGPTSAGLTQLTHTIAHRVGRFLERQGLLERDAENSYLSGGAVEGGLLDRLLGHSITYRIAVRLTPQCTAWYEASRTKLTSYQDREVNRITEQ